MVLAAISILLGSAVISNVDYELSHSDNEENALSIHSMSSNDETGNTELMALRSKKTLFGNHSLLRIKDTIFLESKNDEYILRSPGGTLQATCKVVFNRLSLNLTRNGKTVVEDSALGITIDNVDLGHNVTIGTPSATVINESYPWQGKKSVIDNHCNEYVIPVTHMDSGKVYSVRLRVYNDGLAYRYEIQGANKQIVNGEQSSWVLPTGSMVWYQTNTVNYEGRYQEKFVTDIPLEVDIGPPMAFKLESGIYGAITEGALYDYSGMTLKYKGERLFKAAFLDGHTRGNGEPWNGGWAIEGDVVTPWRVTITADDLNELVNADIVYNVNPPPDPTINWSFVQPGRCVWSWWAHGNIIPWSSIIPGLQFRLQKLLPWAYKTECEYIEYASQLDFEYILFDAGWPTFSTKKFNSLLSKAESEDIGVWVWKYWKTLDTDAERHAFYKWCKEKGIKGVKIDFIDDESKTMIDFYEPNLRIAAEYKVMINFHGANKPTGYPRKYPNEMTREAVKGLEYKRFFHHSLQKGHDSALLFTRMVGGFADYTPVTFSYLRMGKSSSAHQLANAILFVSPLTHWADDPEIFLKMDPRIIDIIKTMPTTWDETVVLEGSEIMDAAGVARRKEDTWFIGIVNDENPCDFHLNLSFLDPGMSYNAVFVEDTKSGKHNWHIRNTIVKNTDTIDLYLRKEGGFVAKITPTA